MTIQFRKSYILVTAPALVKWWGRLTTGTLDAKGAAFFPFIFIRDAEFDVPWLINHERIHFRQSIETGLTGLPIISTAERIYARFVLRKSKIERYLYTAAEQEAYQHQNDPLYLSHRPFGAVYFYIKHKRAFVFGAELGEIKYIDG